jgi:hypothetical protein
MATHFRRLWLSASSRVLRRRGHWERYLDVVSDDLRAHVTGGPAAATWLPIDIALAHYEACDALRLDETEQVAVGQEVALLALRKTFALALRRAGQPAATPWTAFGLFKRHWLHVWRGGDLASFKMGSCEARVEFAAWPCAGIPYVRQAMRGVLLGQTRSLCAEAKVEILGPLCTATTLGYAVTWT